MRRTLLLPLLVAVETGSVALADGRQIDPGNWHYTVQTQIPSVPFPIPPLSYTQCLKQSDVDNNKAFSDRKSQNGDCHPENLVNSGGKVSYDVVCKDPGVHGHYDFTFSATHIDGKGTLVDKDNTVTTTYQAERTGSC